MTTMQAMVLPARRAALQLTDVAARAPGPDVLMNTANEP